MVLWSYKTYRGLSTRPTTNIKAMPEMILKWETLGMADCGQVRTWPLCSTSRTIQPWWNRPLLQLWSTSSATAFLYLPRCSTTSGATVVKSADGSWTPPKELGQQKGYRYLHNGRQQRDFLDDLGVEAEGAKPSDLINRPYTDKAFLDARRPLFLLPSACTTSWFTT